ncbi:hypothetical protein ACMU_19075 [Actibacterium mucosum KCTC 23349]|uniref:Cell division protein FtsL n=1 Tax=Actibacterium mucosum KCTC 23349 TaxID=1454373 RepID=A0A037ZFL1_9RHOB|nr:cell division protein FtsL [Actibacterium mucosum]KAJ54326.1 hypothetical protein ACMU_19075 [Actibacterium mucosum KCTC 23349]
MRGFFYVLAGVVVIGLAYWAYYQNFQTQQAIRKAEHLQREIASMRGSLAVLRAEWSYLNRPDRLRELSELNFDRLGLFPLRPEQFGRIDQVAFPVDPDLLDYTTPVEVIGTIPQEERP